MTYTKEDLIKTRELIEQFMADHRLSHLSFSSSGLIGAFDYDSELVAECESLLGIIDEINANDEVSE